MSDESWTYRVRGTLTDEERAIAEDALRLLIEGKLTAYSMGIRGASFGSSTIVDCRSEQEARSEALRIFGDQAREKGVPVFLRRASAPSGRNNWFRPAGISTTIEIRPGLVDVEPGDRALHPTIELDPDQKEMAL